MLSDIVARVPVGISDNLTLHSYQSIPSRPNELCGAIPIDMRNPELPEQSNFMSLHYSNTAAVTMTL